MTDTTPRPLTIKCEMGYLQQCDKDGRRSSFYHDWLREQMPRTLYIDEAPGIQLSCETGVSGFKPITSPPKKASLLKGTTSLDRVFSRASIARIFGNGAHVDSPFMRLPTELHLLIHKHLKYSEVVALRATCRYFRQLVEPGSGLMPRRPPSLREGLLKRKGKGEHVVTTYNIAVLGYRTCDIIDLFTQAQVPKADLRSRDTIIDTVQYDVFNLHRPFGPPRIFSSGCPLFYVDDHQLSAVHFGAGLSYNRAGTTTSYQYSFNWGDCVIVAYSLLSRVSFERAIFQCRRVKGDTNSPGMLLGVLMTGQDEARRTVNHKEALQFAESIKFQYEEVKATRSDVLPLRTVLADLIRPLQDAEEEYVRRNEKTSTLSRLLPGSLRLLR